MNSKLVASVISTVATVALTLILIFAVVGVVKNLSAPFKQLHELTEPVRK